MTITNNPDKPTRAEIRAKTQLHFDAKKEPSRTKQSFKDEVNVNNIVKKYETTGFLQENNVPGQFGDFSNQLTYQESLNQIMLAQNSFSELPSQLRKHFDNDPQKFMDFYDNPENLSTLQQWGLVERPEPEAPPTTPLSETAPTEPPASPDAK